MHHPIEMSGEAAENTYAVASLIMRLVRWLLSLIGEEHHPVTVRTVYAIVVFLIAFGIGILIQKFVVWVIHLIGDRLRHPVYRHLLDAHFFTKICRIIPPLLFLVLIEFTMTGKMGHWLTIVTVIYMIVVATVAIVSLVEATWQHIDEKDNKRKLPLKGLVQLVKGIIWIVALIVIFGILLDKSPEKLLAGLGAFAAVLMLVFKDSILGVVAGVQLSENDTLHVGDWIKVHGTDADGTVEEVTLTTVKIQNWDKTVTTVPPYTLISGSFTNMRTMQESNTRRIQRWFYIDADSVTPLDRDTLLRLQEVDLIKDFITEKLKHLNDKTEGKPQPLVTGLIETNLGLFRAYMKKYLDANTSIDKNSTCFVTTLQQTTYGIPLQVYCFTNTSSWVPYEDIQASIFEHMAVMLHKFGLCLYEAPSGRDTILEGYLPAAGIDKVFGLPFPFPMSDDVMVRTTMDSPTPHDSSQTPPSAPPVPGASQ